MNSNRSPLPIVQEDPYLEPYEKDIDERLRRFRERLASIEHQYGSLERFASGHEYFGFNYDPGQKGWSYREWAPAAKGLFLIGDFNGWDRDRNPLTRSADGVWETFLPDDEYAGRLSQSGRVKVHVVAANGRIDRIPAYVREIARDPETRDFAGYLDVGRKPFPWSDSDRSVPPLAEPIIYECHPGMALEKEGVATWREFADQVLPRIRDAGYNSIQLMAVQHHPYYGSFGYHVSSFFAPAYWFGKPEDLKRLVNEAHRMGLAVIMDVVHSHAVKNVYEGINDFDGSGHQYFLPGLAGEHRQWDSKIFDYGKERTQQFLLSNLKYWIEEFHFDGFRFDGVTSMLYAHHGLEVAFNHYDKYFREATNHNAVLYLQLANALVHRIKPGALTVAEDMSGMPGMSRPIEAGGLGFDFRLAMGLPDYWIKLLKHYPDEAWDVQDLWHVLTDRRYREKTIAYAESHDQALVGDKTIAHWLLDKEIYFNMHVGSKNVTVDRGIALHKMIRLITISAGGEGYLNFIGNEFGHPEWVDFPREGNQWSFKRARRLWSLEEDPNLRYRFLAAFDRAMLRAIRENHILAADPARLLNADSANKTLVFERNNLVFCFNFHPSRSITDYRFAVPKAGDYRILLNTDSTEFNGFGRVDDRIAYSSFDVKGVETLSLYMTNRTALILKREES